MNRDERDVHVIKLVNFKVRHFTHLHRTEDFAKLLQDQLKLLPGILAVLRRIS